MVVGERVEDRASHESSIREPRNSGKVTTLLAARVAYKRVNTSVHHFHLINPNLLEQSLIDLHCLEKPITTSPLSSSIFFFKQHFY